jgi:uncharacterized radical SAM superfamily Fe-S cluster-containing enzyme
MKNEDAFLHATRALCPHCLRVLPAQIAADDRRKVWMTRVCPEHGEIETMIWPDAEHYRWMMSLAFPKVLPDSEAVRPSARPCPTGCGICQRHQRKPTLVEVEVTQRCNLRCPVCFMSAEASFSDVPLERLDDFYAAIVQSSGTDTGVQLTGGEPTVRTDLPEVVRRARACGFWGVEVNTNGVVIAHDLAYLRELAESGLTGIYLQFDGLTADVYRQIRGADLLDIKLRAVKNCRIVGVQVVLAMTIVAGINDAQVGAVIAYALANSDVIAGVALQPAFTSGRFAARRVAPLSMGDVIFMLEEQTAGLIRAEDIWPLGCSHPLCDTGTYLIPRQVDGRAIRDKEGETGRQKRWAGGYQDGHQEGWANERHEGHQDGCQGEPQDGFQGGFQSGLQGGLQDAPPDAPPEIFSAFTPATRDLTRDEYLDLYNPDSPQGSVFLDILARRGTPTSHGVSVIIMNYMDAWTMDLERMEECSMFVTMPDGALVPFCSYQLTDCRGRRVFPPWNIPGTELGAIWQ